MRKTDCCSRHLKSTLMCLQKYKKRDENSNYLLTWLRRWAFLVENNTAAWWNKARENQKICKNMLQCHCGQLRHHAGRRNDTCLSDLLHEVKPRATYCFANCSGCFFLTVLLICPFLTMLLQTTNCLVSAVKTCDLIWFFHLEIPCHSRCINGIGCITGLANSLSW